MDPNLSTSSRSCASPRSLFLLPLLPLRLAPPGGVAGLSPPELLPSTDSAAVTEDAEARFEFPHRRGQTSAARSREQSLREARPPLVIRVPRSTLSPSRVSGEPLCGQSAPRMLPVRSFASRSPDESVMQFVRAPTPEPRHPSPDTEHSRESSFSLDAISCGARRRVASGRLNSALRRDVARGEGSARKMLARGARLVFVELAANAAVEIWRVRLGP